MMGFDASTEQTMNRAYRIKKLLQAIKAAQDRSTPAEREPTIAETCRVFDCSRRTAMEYLSVLEMTGQIESKVGESGKEYLVIKNYHKGWTPAVRSVLFPEYQEKLEEEKDCMKLPERKTVKEEELHYWKCKEGDYEDEVGMEDMLKEARENIRRLEAEIEDERQ